MIYLSPDEHVTALPANPGFLETARDEGVERLGLRRLRFTLYGHQPELLLNPGSGGFSRENAAKPNSFLSSRSRLREVKRPRFGATGSPLCSSSLPRVNAAPAGTSRHAENGAVARARGQNTHKKPEIREKTTSFPVRERLRGERELSQTRRTRLDANLATVN